MSDIIKDIYQEVKNKSLIPNLEALEVIEEVARYKNYWKPNQVKTILLAESHVRTDKSEYICEINPEFLEDDKQPKNFVRYVYCLGYGEKTIVQPDINDNPGTRQYWEIFFSCGHKINSQADFFPLTNGGIPDVSTRINNKYELLNTLKAIGVWLLDASLFGIYPWQPGFNNNHYHELLGLCWKKLIKQEILDANPINIIVIGKKVYNSLKIPIENLHDNISIHVQKQPQAHMTRAERLAQFQKYYKICNS